jgi:transglutaminase-like putative cysteine protease
MTPRFVLAAVGGAATLLAGFSVLPIVTGSRWLPLSLATVAVVVLLGEGLRRTRCDPVLVACLQLLTLLYAGTLAAVGATGIRYALPTPTWFEHVAATLAGAVADLQQYAPPVPESPGLVLMIVASTGLAAIAVDTLIASGRVPWTGVPLVALHLIPAIGAPRGVSWPGFLLTAVGYLAVLLVDRRQQVLRWGRPVARSATPGTGLSGLRELDRGGRRLGALAVAVAMAVPVVMPQLSLGFLGGGDGTGGQTIRTHNPILDLRRDLVRPGNIELFRYLSDGPSTEYIRVVTLDVFDGEQWKPSDRRIPRSQRVGEGLPQPPGRADLPDELRTRETFAFEVLDSYESHWLPLPYAARVVEVEGDWRYDLGTLDVIGLDTDTRGLQYRVVSEVLAPTADVLSSSEDPPQGFERLQALPTQLLPDLRPLLADAVPEDGTPYEQAVALQDWFRSTGGFTYDLATEPGNSSSALRDFLTDRRGYCEQFAATMAIMARALGIPARVAVGFMPGTRERSGETVVRAHDSHAWPELYFSGVGWVRFEPTPSTQTGAAPAWTVAGSAQGPDTPEGGAAASASPTAEQGPQVRPDLQDVGASGGEVDLGTRIPWRWIGVLAGVLLLLTLPSVTAVLRRRRRWSRAGAAVPAQAEAAWTELEEAATDVGLRWEPSFTPRTSARVTADETGLSDADRARLDRLVSATERARYASGPAAAAGGASLQEDAARLRSAVLASASRGQRWRARLWPAATQSLVRPRERVDEESVDV